jgi:hypothetical protein
MMASSTDAICELVTLAATPPERVADAKRLLRHWLIVPSGRKSAARSLFDAAAQRGTPSGHNHHLERVVTALDKLQQELRELQRRPYAHTDFWSHEGFGEIENSDFERPEVMSLLATMREAATAAMIERNGRPFDLGKQRIVDTALSVFVRISEAEPTAYHGNPFPEFARRFYELVVGEPVSLERQIAAALAHRKRGGQGYTPAPNESPVI